MAKFATVGAERDTAVLNEPGRGETLEVLLWRLWPALSKFGAARLSRQLNRQNEIPVGVTNQVDDRHVLSDLLLLGDEVDTKSVVAQSLFDQRKAELVGGRASVGSQTDAEGIEILRISCVDQGTPGVFGSHLRDASPVDDAPLIAFKCLVAGLVAESALLGVGRAATRSMALLTASVTCASKWALNAFVRAISFIVADLSAVVTLSRETASLGLVRTVTSDVIGLSAAVGWSVNEQKRLRACRGDICVR